MVGENNDKATDGRLLVERITPEGLEVREVWETVREVEENNPMNMIENIPRSNVVKMVKQKEKNKTKGVN